MNGELCIFALIKTSFPIDLKNTEMGLISNQSLSLSLSHSELPFLLWFIVVAAILFKNNLSSFRHFISASDGDDGGSSDSIIWRLLNQYYLFAMLPIQLNLALIELPFECLRLVLYNARPFVELDELKTTSIDMYQ